MNFVEANGVRFAYLEQGQGPLVLLVHGFPDTARTWEVTMKAVAAAGFRAVAPFTRGYGPTAIPSDGKYDTETLGRDLVALIPALGVERAIVVGHDQGARAAYSAAALAPVRMERLITVAVPHPHSIKPTPVLAWKMRHLWTLSRKNAERKVAANDFAMIDDLWRRWSPAWKDLPTEETADVKRALKEPGGLHAVLGYYRGFSARLPGPRGGRIHVPTFSFAGLDDEVFPPPAYERARPWFTQGYEVVAIPGGHFLQREHPDVFARELVRVLRSNAPSAGPAR